MHSALDWPVLPMEPVTIGSAYDSEDTLFQLKWDGVRILAYIYPNGEIRLFNRRLNERTIQYPELQKSLAGLKGGTVLDGEIVTLGPDGKPDFPRILQRDLVRSPFKIQTLINSIPINYMVLDVLWSDEKPCYNFPLIKRMEILDGINFDSNIVHKVESIFFNGKALYEAVKAEGLEGIVAKEVDSPYRIGKKSDEWQKIKCFRNITGVVGGYLSDENGRIRSLLVGIPKRTCFAI